MDSVTLLLGLITFMTVTIHGQGQVMPWDPFDCRRLNSHCRTDVGVCMIIDGSCDCSAANPPVPGWQGFDCNLQNSTIGCAKACQNGGTCFRAAQPSGPDVDTCYCTERYSGDNCEKMRVGVDVCNGTHIVMYFKPHHANQFDGAILVVQDLGFRRERPLPACAGVQQPDQSFLLTATLYDTADPCYPALQVTNTTAGELLYQYDVRVYYSGSDFTTFTDETHSFVCKHDPNGNNGGVLVGDLRPDLGGVRVEGTYKPVSLTIHNRTDQTQGAATGMGPVFVGQELFARVMITETTAYTDLAVDTCTAYSGADRTGRNVTFLENRCPSQFALSIVDATVGARRVTRTEVHVAFFGFRFNGLSDLYISCDVTLCGTTSTGNCAPANCSSGTDGAGRKKRQAGNGGDSLSVSDHLIVVNSLADLEMGRSWSVPTIIKEVRIEHQSCLQSTAFLVITPLLGVLLLVALIVAVVVCRRQSSRNNKSSSEKFHVYSNPAMAKA